MLGIFGIQLVTLHIEIYRSVPQIRPPLLATLLLVQSAGGGGGYTQDATFSLMITPSLNQKIFLAVLWMLALFLLVACTTVMTGTAAVKLKAPQLPRVQEFMMKHGL